MREDSRYIGGRLSEEKEEEKVRNTFQYNDTNYNQCFYIINLGGQDKILLGFPFLQAVNPAIDWKSGTFPG